MKAYVLLLTLVLVAADSGCAGNSAKPDGQDPAVYARTIKTQVLEFVQEARRKPRNAGQDAAVLLETLEAHPKKPVGEHQAVYADLTQKCQQLVEASKRSPGSAEVTRKLNEMAAAAGKLPG